MKQKICVNCRKKSDQKNNKLTVGDMSKYPEIIPGVPMKCDHCGARFNSGAEIFLVDNFEENG